MRLTARGALPTVIVIGAQKSGTSALHAYLGLHPEVSISSPKELDFFIAERNWPRGLDWYRSHFDADRPVRGESSPNYTAYPIWKDVPERMATVVPDAKLVYLVRDPLDRIASHWIHNWALRREMRAPEAAIRDDPIYLTRSRYMFQLDRYLALFSAEQILVLDQHDLRRNRHETLEQVYRFVGVDPGFRAATVDVDVNSTRPKRRISAVGAALDRGLRRTSLGRRVPAGAIPRLEALLLDGKIDRPDIRAALSQDALDVLADDAARLRAFTGLALDHWSV
jgi:hypothetical protein